MSEIYEQCRNIGLTDSQRAFSYMWGRADSWFSSAMTRQHERRISTESLLAFYFSLAEVRFSNLTAKQLGVISNLKSELWNEIASRVRP
ncbi:hypothetical protein [Magnetospirillum sulfuroxidans]|uniref:Uncharacterized protein n=1 Tax=Magnetospirillum sulfuroxidans TaxID=611300 RepID=A0ABS5IC96_9PROT|nr:hypothetical protein [Magnetospirillum sulfuroxidans]MBR9972051.1 hypothetical protein [Magnetospirillum sulfuroxidans]